MFPFFSNQKIATIYIYILETVTHNRTKMLSTQTFDWAYGVVVSMFQFFTAAIGVRIPGRGGKIS